MTQSLPQKENEKTYELSAFNGEETCTRDVGARKQMLDAFF